MSGDDVIDDVDDEVRALLVAAGWSAERRALLNPWMMLFIGLDLDMPRSVFAFLQSFAELDVRGEPRAAPFFARGACSFAQKPLVDRRLAMRLQTAREATGLRLFPVGTVVSQSLLLAMGTDTRFYALHARFVVLLGATRGRALRALLLGDVPGAAIWTAPQ